MKINERIFGTVDGQTVTAITLTNRSGAAITAMNYGAALLEWSAPDRDRNFQNITIGLDNLEDYVKNRPYYGATVGRVAGRIAHGKFSLDGIPYQLAQNQNTNHLHGGFRGLDTKVWDFRVEDDGSEARIIFSCSDPAGTNAYPGNLNVAVTYTFTDENEWKIDYAATTDAPTLFNPTNHVYFNLHGNPAETILDHELRIAADRFVELNSETIPTGRKLPVADTPFDFRQPAPARQAVESDHPQTKQAAGLDHPFVLSHAGNETDASLYDKQSGRRIDMVTSEPVVVVFMHNGPSQFEYKNRPIQPYAGITLETQGYPDAINQDDFGNIVLNPGETYRSQTTFKFSLDE